MVKKEFFPDTSFEPARAERLLSKIEARLGSSAVGDVVDG